MNKIQKTSVVGLFCILLLTGCATYNNTAIRPSNNWNTVTGESILTSENHDGGFSNLKTERLPDIYSTYYDYEILKKLNIPLKNKTMFVKTLKSYQQQYTKIEGTIQLAQEEYLCQLDKAFNYSPGPGYIASLQI